MVAPAIGTRNARATKRGIDAYEIARTCMFRKEAGEGLAYLWRRDPDAKNVVNWRWTGLGESARRRDAFKPYVTAFEDAEGILRWTAYMARGGCPKSSEGPRAGYLAVTEKVVVEVDAGLRVILFKLR